MYVAVATASRAAEEAAPVPAVREAQTHLKPLTFSSTLAPTAARPSISPFHPPLRALRRARSHQASPLHRTAASRMRRCDGASVDLIIRGIIRRNLQRNVSRFVRLCDKITRVGSHRNIGIETQFCITCKAKQFKTIASLRRNMIRYRVV